MGAAGVALISALLASLLVLAMLFLVTSLVIRDSRLARNDGEATRLALMADGASDVARLQVMKSYKASKMSLRSWLDALAPCRDQDVCTPLSQSNISPDVQSLTGNHLRTLDKDYSLTWKIVGVSPANTKSISWVQIAATATATSGNGGQQTVLRRVVMGNTDMFDLAMLSERTDCMYCHLKVNGDVGNYNFFSPGWGAESVEGQYSARGSKVNGNIYSASEVSQNGDPGTIKGLTATGESFVNYAGPKLPSDKEGVPAFPGLDLDVARKSAMGTLSGGTSIRGVPIGGTYASAAPVANVGGVYEGNLVIEGTINNPIVLDKDIFVTGDVVIKGYVTGRGAIYAGRNLYVAGNLQNKNRMDKPGTGVCAGETDPDQCARINIANGKDETRLAAGNNIILGDYTEFSKSSTERNSVDYLQSNDYMRNQFALKSWSTRYVQQGTALELTKKDGKYYDGTGKEVPAAQVTTYGNGSAANPDPFTGLMRPGTTNAAGFVPWMSDQEYAGILGKETTQSYVWRYDFSGYTSEAAVATELMNAGIPGCTVDCTTPPNNTAQGMAKLLLSTSKPHERVAFNGPDGKVAGAAAISGPIIRVADARLKQVPKETTRLDAFLYANRRIAGRVSPRGGSINGGLIARELGVLAPGLNDGEAWSKSPLPADVRARFTTCDTSTPELLQAAIAAGMTTEDAGNDPASKACDFAINYDHRLRNGGYGFDLLRGAMGATTQWELDTDGKHAVKP